MAHKLRSLSDIPVVQWCGSGPKPTPVIERFWMAVGLQPFDQCWNWRIRDSDKYGQLAVGGKRFRCHQLSWIIHFGPIPDGVQVLHQCDNTRCANPSHLFLGSQAVNMADMREKGRASRGERSASTKLTERDVLAIREARSEGKPMAVIAEGYGVSLSAVSSIVRRKTWGWLCS